MEIARQDQGALFDYESLDIEKRVVLKQRASEIKTLAKRVATDIVDIGGKLAEVKDALGGNGRFNAWLLSELGWSERTAYNFMAVHQKFGTANFAIENVAPSALYLLVAPNTPEPARAAAIEMANQGEQVTHKVAKVLVESAKEAEPKTAAMFAETPVEDIAVCICGHRADMHDVSGACEEQGDCVCEIYEEASPSEIVEQGAVQKALDAVEEAPVAPVATSTPAPALKRDQLKEIAKAHDASNFWSQAEIVIGITLMPQDKDPRGRQAIVSIKADNGAPVIQSKRIKDTLGEWPEPIEEMISAFAAKLAEPKTPVKSASKPAAKSAAKKSTKKK